GGVAPGRAAGKRSGARRIAVPLTFAALFVAGAASSATAGDQVRSMLEGSAVSSAAAPDTATTDGATGPTASTSTDPAPAADPTDGGSTTASTPTPTEGGDATPPPANPTPAP